MSKEKVEFEEIKGPDRFRRFGIWCSGASTEALSQCPTAWNQFAINGYVILMTAALSFVSGSYFLSFVFPEQDWIIPVIFGAMWAFLIFTLDRSIIVSIKKTDIFWQEFRQGSIRIVLAIFIGIVIATPIELKLFENEIVAKVEENRKKWEENIIEQNNANLEKQLEPKRKGLAELEKIKKEYDDANRERILEAEGKSGTGRVGKGPVYNEKNDRYIEIKTRWDNVQQEYNSLQAEIGRLTNQQTSSSNSSEETNIDGVEARVKALYQLSGLHWFVTLLFIIIECLPVITKLMSKRGTYDETLERIEYETMIEQKEIISRKNFEINELLVKAEEAAKLRGEIFIRVQKIKLDAELKNNETIVNKIAECQQELALEAIEKWKEAEKARVSATYVKTKPILENIRWQAANLTDDVFFFFNVSGKLEYTESGIIEKGIWKYTKPEKEIEIALSKTKEIYVLKNFTADSVDLENSGTIVFKLKRV
jgi:hypothetical protein